MLDKRKVNTEQNTQSRVGGMQCRRPGSQDVSASAAAFE